jgi:hypothetical protein
MNSTATTTCQTSAGGAAREPRRAAHRRLRSLRRPDHRRRASGASMIRLDAVPDQSGPYRAHHDGDRWVAMEVGDCPPSRVLRHAPTRAHLRHPRQAARARMRAALHNARRPVTISRRDGRHGPAVGPTRMRNSGRSARLRRPRPTGLAASPSPCAFWDAWPVHASARAPGRKPARVRRSPTNRAIPNHVAPYLIAHGEGEWQCVSTGGLRW